MTTLLELAKKLHNTLALYNGAGHALGWKTEKVDKLLDESKRVIELAEQPAQQEPVEYWTVANGWVSEQAEVPAAVWVEPDFWEHCNRVNCGTAYRLPAPGRQPLYASPPAQRTWVGLTDEELVNVMPDDDTPMSLGEAFSKFAELIEAKLKERNVCETR